MAEVSAEPVSSAEGIRVWLLTLMTTRYIDECITLDHKQHGHEAHPTFPGLAPVDEGSREVRRATRPTAPVASTSQAGPAGVFSSANDVQ